MLKIQVVSFTDLYAGKLVAALDRQHPRDLFDVQYLLANEGIDETLFQTFLVYILSHNRPAHELLQPHLKDIRQAFDREFVGMRVNETSLDTLLSTREQMVSELGSHLNEISKLFFAFISCTKTGLESHRLADHSHSPGDSMETDESGTTAN